jgi:hypothetical protein
MLPYVKKKRTAYVNLYHEKYGIRKNLVLDPGSGPKGQKAPDPGYLFNTKSKKFIDAILAKTQVKNMRDDAKQFNTVNCY